MVVAQRRGAAAPPAATPAAEGDGDGGGKMVKENETEGETMASGVIEKEQKAANERWGTAKPPAGFEELSPFGKFAKAPDVTPPCGGAPVQLGRVLDKALLFGKTSKKPDDGIFTLNTYDVVAPRPKIEALGRSSKKARFMKPGKYSHVTWLGGNKAKY